MEDILLPNFRPKSYAIIERYPSFSWDSPPWICKEPVVPTHDEAVLSANPWDGEGYYIVLK